MWRLNHIRSHSYRSVNISFTDIVVRYHHRTIYDYVIEELIAVVDQRHSLFVSYRRKYDKIIASQSAFRLISIVDRWIDTGINQPSLPGERPFYIALFKSDKIMTVLFKICQEVFRTSKAQTDRVFMILTVYSSLFPRREHFYPSVSTRARSMYDPLAYISDTPRVSYKLPPSGDGASKPRSASRALFLVSGDETRVDAVGWTKRDAWEILHVNNSPIPRTGENWPASPRVATLIDIRRAHAPHQPWRRATLRR